jgi:pimeloyl-ACP methyl ester carboxylesterase
MIKKIETESLVIGYREYGDVNDIPVILLHGFPYDINSYNDTSDILSKKNFRVFTPYLRGFGHTTFKDTSIMRTGQQGAIAKDVIDFMDALKIPKAIIAGYDWGGRTACIVSALWSERVLGLVSVGGYTIQNILGNKEPLPPNMEQLYWYQYYFHTERGGKGLAKYRKELCKILWTEWSPDWKFDDATFEKTAESYNNPDFIDIVIHSYKHRYGVAEGDKQYNSIERSLATTPAIKVPTIVLESGNDGFVNHFGFDDNREHFKGKYSQRIVYGAGHNLPQETPQEFANAIIELSEWIR